MFAAIGQHCGPYLKRVPDGEPGGRRLWISWQIPVLRANPSLAQVGEGQIPLKLADGVEPGRIHFGELGYSREARPSYEDFVAARTAGRLPAGVRFQVSLPTPWAVIMPFCRQPDAQQIYPAYEQAMLQEVARICKAIPHHDLAIQWDVCIEMLAWDGRWQNAQAFPGMEQVFAGNFARLGAAVPAGVELGFHLCYGDLDARHFVEPVDAAKMVELANLIARSVQRPIAWNMPVPIDRADDAFYAPLEATSSEPARALSGWSMSGRGGRGGQTYGRGESMSRPSASLRMRHLARTRPRSRARSSGVCRGGCPLGQMIRDGCLSGMMPNGPSLQGFDLNAGCSC